MPEQSITEGASIPYHYNTRTVATTTSSAVDLGIAEAFRQFHQDWVTETVLIGLKTKPNKKMRHYGNYSLVLEIEGTKVIIFQQTGEGKTATKVVYFEGVFEKDTKNKAFEELSKLEGILDDIREIHN